MPISSPRSAMVRRACSSNVSRFPFSGSAPRSHRSMVWRSGALFHPAETRLSASERHSICGAVRPLPVSIVRQCASWMYQRSFILVLFGIRRPFPLCGRLLWGPGVCLSRLALLPRPGSRRLCPFGTGSLPADSPVRRYALSIGPVGRAPACGASSPRGRGSHARRPPEGGAAGGSSPQARGSRGAHVDASRLERVIPAPAGQSSSRDREYAGGTGHPRACGAVLRTACVVAGLKGSSPRGRGARLRYGRHARAVRCIPAWAGRSSASRRSGVPPRLHPRVRGGSPLASRPEDR